MGIEIYLEDEKRAAHEGATVAEFLGDAYIKERAIVACLMDFHLVGLNTKIRRGCNLRPVHSGAPLGRVVLKRTISHMLHAVVAEIFPDITLVVGQSFLGGHYYEIVSQNGRKIDASYIAEKLTGGSMNWPKRTSPSFSDMCPWPKLWKFSQTRTVPKPVFYKPGPGPSFLWRSLVNL